MRDARHVVVDARMVHHAGVGTYIRNLVPRVAAALSDWRFTALVPHAAPSRLFGDVATVSCRSDIYSIAEQLELPRVTPGDASLFWSPHYNIPLLSRRPVVVTVHDVAHLARPEHRGVSGVVRGLYARSLLAEVRRRADTIVFVSDFSRREFTRLVGTPRRSTIVHNGVDNAWHRSAAHDAARPHSRPYILFVGSVKPHKNLAGLLRAFDILRGEVPHDLLIVGSHTGMRTIDVASMRAAQSSGGRVQLLGRVANEALHDYVAHADVLVFPSLYEGFGLPPLEAMASGCACAVSDISAVREVCGDAAAYFDPHDPAAIAATLRRVLHDRPFRTALVERGYRQASRYSWDSAAAQVAATLVDAAGRTRR